MNTEQLQPLFQRATQLKNALDTTLTTSTQRRALEDLLVDIAKNEHYITVLGEFKRGKSTLFNALLKTELLPAQVTPTTATINLVHYAEQEQLTIYYENGEVIDKGADLSALSNLSFTNGTDFTDIHHVEVKTKHQQLGENVILVDTPGVGDLNEHRIDVTYSYIPRSSIVVFVVDCTTPLRRSELDYLANHVVPNLHGELIIVANFFDRIDEDEWEEETEEYLTKKLKKALKDVPYKLFAVSAKGVLDNDDSGEFSAFEKHIEVVLRAGKATHQKLLAYENRFQVIKAIVTGEVFMLQKLYSASEEELEQVKNELSQFKAKEQAFHQTIESYLKDRQQDILQLTEKSVATFETRLIEKALQEIDDHPGGKFKSYLEIQVPKMIQNEVNTWVSMNYHQIDVLIQKAEEKTYDGIERLLKTNIRSLENNRLVSRSQTGMGRIKVDGKDDSAAIASGSIVAGMTMGGLLLFGAVPFLPVIALVGYPLLNQFIGNSKLDKAKAEAKPVVKKSIQEMVSKLKHVLAKYIETEIHRVKLEVIRELSSTMRKFEQELNDEIVRKKQNVQAIPMLSPEQIEAI